MSERAIEAALKTAIEHINHMAAWISEPDHNSCYSFESLGEDMPGMRAALAAAQRAGKHKCNAYTSVELRAWEFVKDGFKSFNLSDDRLRVYAGIIAELIQGAIDDDCAAAQLVVEKGTSPFYKTLNEEAAEGEHCDQDYRPDPVSPGKVEGWRETIPQSFVSEFMAHRHFYAARVIDIVARKDAREYHLQGDWLKEFIKAISSRAEDS